MKASGNGRPEQCAVNLLLITRGEIPFDRIKGRDAALIDAPISTTAAQAEADAEWLLSTYEPRMSVEEINISDTVAQVGDYGVNAKIIMKKEGESDE